MQNYKTENTKHKKKLLKTLMTTQFLKSCRLFSKAAGKIQKYKTEKNKNLSDHTIP
jgi:hypothetical protein